MNSHVTHFLRSSARRPSPGGYFTPPTTVATRWPDSQQSREIEMPFVAQRPGYIEERLVVPTTAPCTVMT